ncbi:MAG: hypothetical protein WC455_20010 [Dehalococcoidia bacterium]|jgi:hypothetical protein
MKRLLILLCVLLLCIAPVMGIRENFQDWTNESVMLYPSIDIQISNQTRGDIGSFLDGGDYVINPTPLPSAYAAWDIMQGSPGYSHSMYVVLYDSSHTEIVLFGTNGLAGRYEIKIIGGIPSIYYNHIILNNYTSISQNPSYIKIWNQNGYYGYGRVDNIIFGEDDHHVVGALPSNWTITRDFVSSASNGVYAGQNTTSLTPWVLKNSYYFYIDADTDSLDDVTTENFQISNVATGTVVNTTVINSTVPRHQIRYYLSQWLDTSTIPDGQYAACFEGSAVCDYFWIQSNGGWINFDKSTYTLGDTGQMSWYLSEGYIDLSTYTYTYKIVDVYGDEKAAGITATTSTDTSGTVSINFDSQTYDAGVIYAEMIATSKTSGTSYVLGYTVITLNDYLNFYGKVYDANTTAVISGALVNFTQLGTSTQYTTSADGVYSVADLVTGGQVIINVTESNYVPYNYSFTPIATGNKSLDFALLPLSHNTTGNALAGVARDTTYGNPIPYAKVWVQNVTTGEYYQRTANSLGYHYCDAADCTLVSGRLYDVWGSKTGYSNSTVYQPVIS